MASLRIEKTEDLLNLSREELRDLIVSLQARIQAQLKAGLSIDELLDEEDPFEILEPVLPTVEYPILVLALINNFQSAVVMDTILTALEEGLARWKG